MTPGERKKARSKARSVARWAGVAAVIGLVLYAGDAVVQATTQEESGGARFADRMDVELVTVDVWVTDRRGEPATGLEATAFEVLHDGLPVTVTHFTEVGAGRAAASDAAARGRRGERPATEDGDRRSKRGSPARGSEGITDAGASPSHLVLYFDQSRIHPSRYPSLARSLEHFLEADSIPSERILILRQDRSLTVEAPFGSTRRELELAVQRLAGSSAPGIDHETETRLALEAIRDGWEQAQDAVGSAVGGLAAAPASAGSGQPPGPGSAASGSAGGPRAVVGGVGSGSGPDACGMFVNQIQPVLDSWTRSNRQRIAVTLTNLSSAAGFLAGLPGVKALLYFSDGLETQPGAELATYAGNLCASAGTDLLTGTLSEQMTSGFRDLTRHANSNRVTIYALETTGLRALGGDDAAGGRQARGSGPRARAAFEASKRVGDRQGLEILAEETGGRAIVNRNDLGPELVRVGAELQHYYALAYALPARQAGRAGEQSTARRDHEIVVRLTDDALSARYRRGYLEKSPRQWLTERIEGALHLGLTSNPLGVRLGAGATEATATGSLRMPLHVMVPVENLAFLPDQDQLYAEVRLQVLSRALEGGGLVSQEQSFRVRGARGATGLANLVLPLELDPGAHVTAIGVQDQGTGVASFVSTTLQVAADG